MHCLAGTSIVQQALLAQQYRTFAPSSHNLKHWAQLQHVGLTSGAKLVGQPAYYCHRPPWAAGLPAPLMHPAFGTFKDAMGDPSLITPHDYAFAAELCEVSLRPFSTELERQAGLKSLLEGYLKTSISGYSMFEGDCTYSKDIVCFVSGPPSGHCHCRMHTLSAIVRRLQGE